MLISEHQQLSKEWHTLKNGDLKSSSITCGSRKKVWWMCPKGHEWQAIVCNRSRGKGCPICTGRLVDINNCLATIYPHLVKEWHPVKNEPLTAYNVTCGSGKQVWWICEKGHEWRTAVGEKEYWTTMPALSWKKPHNGI